MVGDSTHYVYANIICCRASSNAQASWMQADIALPDSICTVTIDNKVCKHKMCIAYLDSC